MSRLRLIPLLAVMALLGGCNFVVMDPSGDVASQQRNLVVTSTILMLLIIIPVMVLTVLFAWHYRSSNKKAVYTPDWDHSTQLELVIWAAPLMIIICLGALTWMGSHMLDPYRQIGRIDATRPLPYDPDPIEVDVVALDWKWLFIYPKQGIATVNDVAAPIDRAIDFHITSATVMNSFYIPALAGQIYAMPGMETKLHAVINAAGQADFDKWVAKAKAAGQTLDRATYLALEHPSENVQPAFYANVAPNLYDAILNLCVQQGKMCIHEMMAIDQKGGLGLAGVNNTLPLTYDKYARRGAVFGPEGSYVASLCTPTDPTGRGLAATDAGAATPPRVGTAATPPNPASGAPLLGHALPRLSAMPTLSPVSEDTSALRRPFHS